MIAGLRADGTTILLIEQNAALALDVADRVLVMGNGRIVTEGTPRSLLDDPGLAHTYLDIAGRPPHASREDRQ